MARSAKEDTESQVMLPEAMNLPWHQASWDRLARAWQDSRWPHGIVVYGSDGVGTLPFAARLARVLVCDRPSTAWDACGECASCRLYTAGTHPDVTYIAPEEDKQQISVDQVRDACRELAMTSFRQGQKVAVIAPANQMTLAAANSLLKTLEEPAPNTTLILVTQRLGALLPTLRSRCQHVPLRVPATDVAINWLRDVGGKSISAEILAFAHGAPMRALELADGRFDAIRSEVSEDIESLAKSQSDVTQIAKRWADEGLSERLACLDRMMCSHIRTAFAQSADSFTSELLPTGRGQLNISRMYGCVDRIRLLQQQLSRTALQRELAVDAILIDIHEALNPVRRAAG